ncbi:MAG TPA: ABC transporter ATP-binding protein [Deltaproteobacteria bacterium]|nr:ABC transporter ATP-binding protein [Deltaproteobacteria bacterium]
MLEIKSVYFRHQRNESDILKEVDFSVRAGGMNTILGPNGSGKTTLFRCITGLWKLQRGKIVFEDKDISRISHAERAKIFAVVPQEHEPPFPYSVLDVVLMGRVSHVGLFASPTSDDYEVAEKAIQTVGISHLRDRAYTKISGGERQLVLIARALSQEAPILLLDEPTSHLDFRNQVVVLKKVREITRERGLTVLMTLHDPNLAMLFSDKVVVLNGGSVICTGSPNAVITEDTMKRVYGIDVSLIPWNGTRVVYPRI